MGSAPHEYPHETPTSQEAVMVNNLISNTRRASCYFIMVACSFSLIFTSCNNTTQDEKKLELYKINRLSELDPFLGKRIQVKGKVVYSHKRKELPYFLLDDNPLLKIGLGGRKVMFFKKLNLPSFEKDSQRAIIDGVLVYSLTDFSLKKNQQLKLDIIRGDICLPLPPKHGEFILMYPSVVKLIRKKTTEKYNMRKVKSTAKEKELLPCYIHDGNVDKFKRYIQHLRNIGN